MEDTLLRNLFRGYQKWVRPILHANDTITVRFGLKISQLVDVVRQTHLYCNIWSLGVMKHPKQMSLLNTVCKHAKGTEEKVRESLE